MRTSSFDLDLLVDCDGSSLDVNKVFGTEETTTTGCSMGRLWSAFPFLALLGGSIWFGEMEEGTDGTGT